MVETKVMHTSLSRQRGQPKLSPAFIFQKKPKFNGEVELSLLSSLSLSFRSREIIEWQNAYVDRGMSKPISILNTLFHRPIHIFSCKAVVSYQFFVQEFKANSTKLHRGISTLSKNQKVAKMFAFAREMITRCAGYKAYEKLWLAWSFVAYNPPRIR